MIDLGEDVDEGRRSSGVVCVYSCTHEWHDRCFAKPREDSINSSIQGSKATHLLFRRVLLGEYPGSEQTMHRFLNTFKNHGRTTNPRDR